MKTRIHHGSLWQLVGAMLAIVNLWIVALLLALYSLFQALQHGFSTLAGSTSMSAAAFFMAGCLCLPSAYYALRRLFTWKTVDSHTSLGRFHPILLALVFFVVLGMGYLVSRLNWLSWLLLPLLQVLAIGLPVMWLLYVAVRRLPLGSSQRLWGVFNSGLVLGPALILLFELAALLILAVLAAMAIANQPELLDRIPALSEQLSSQGLTQEDVLEVIGPFLQRPSVILSILVFAALVVPMIEEAFKPVGAWLLIGRRLTPAAGFAAGAVSGAGYALFESLMLSRSGEDWVWVILGRAGTAVLHIATSSLMGWALVQALNGIGVIRLGLVYLSAVLVHGSWNALVIINALLILPAEWKTSFISQNTIGWVEKVAPIVLVLLVILMFSMLFWANRKLARAVVQGNLEPVPMNSGLHSV